MAWDMSCRDWEERIRAGRSLVPELPLDRDQADRAIAIFNRLKLPDVPGTPALQAACGDWFRDSVAALFGSLVGGTRMVRELFELVPKKNAKTTGGGAIMLTALMTNRRPRAEFLLIGPTQAISETAYNQAVGMIEADLELKKRFRVQDHIKRITYRGAVTSTLQIKTFDTSVLTGVKPVGVLIDELHELGKIARAADVIRQVRGGLLPFPEGFLVFITTQSQDPPAGVFRAELLKARKIRDGAIPARGMLPVLYEFPRAMIDSGEWREPKFWPLVNPNIDRSVTLARLIEDHDTAVETGEAELRGWASQHLNIEIGLALHTDRWAGADYWEDRADRALTLATLIARADVITIGIDGGGLDDLLGLAVLGRDRDTREWLLWTRAWVHKDALGEFTDSDDAIAKAAARKRRKSDVAPRLRDFAAQGDVVIVDELGQDIVELVEIVVTVNASGKLPEKNAIGLDPVGVGLIVDELGRRGIDTAPEAGLVVGVSQGWKLTGAIKTTERKLADKSFTHAGQPLMAWSVGNAKVEPRGNAITITKQTSGSAKIDPLMATFDAAALMAMNPAPAEHNGAGIVVLDAA